MDVTLKLRRQEVIQLVRSILRRGHVGFRPHALEEMTDEDMGQMDVRNILSAGEYHSEEFKDGTWRYRFETQTMGACVAFRSETHFVVVTAFRTVKT